MKNLLYVCRHNVDRSFVAKLITKEAGYGNLNIDSAGLVGLERYPQGGRNRYMVETLSKMGYPDSEHEPKVATIDLFENQDLILCMSPNQVKEILRRTPSSKGKVFTLPEYAGFSNKKINSPPDMMKKPKEDFNYKAIFPRFRAKAYPKLGMYAQKILGKITHDDYRGIIAVHKCIINRIDTCVNKTLERMVRENMISEPSLE